MHRWLGTAPNIVCSNGKNGYRCSRVSNGTLVGRRKSESVAGASGSSTRRGPACGIGNSTGVLSTLDIVFVALQDDKLKDQGLKGVITANQRPVGDGVKAERWVVTCDVIA